MIESLGTASSNPGEGQTPQQEAARDGEAAPSDWAILEADWRYWFARAHVAWAHRYAPWLLEEWLR